MENVPNQDEGHFQRQSVSFPTPVAPKKKLGIKVLILVVLLLLIGGIAWFVVSSENPFSPAEPTPTPTVFQEMPTSTPSPTPVPVAKSELQVRVQNGTGVPGEAAFLETEIKKLGFTTVETANADNKNYTTTEVAFSSRVSDEIRTEVSTKLQELYTNVTVSESAFAGIDIQIITGTRKGQKSVSATPTVKSATKAPTATPTKTGTVTPTGATTGTVTPTKTPTPAT